jgi:hypothetical protein
LVLRLNGGGWPSIQFNSLNEPIIRTFSKKAHDWQIIDEGLNLDGKCKNKNCEAYLKYVCINKGFGKFDMNKEVHTAPCPMCSEFC